MEQNYSGKKRNLPYAKIRWDKVAQLFARVPQKEEKNKRLTAKTILRNLARVADLGIAFIAKAHDPAVAELILEGTGPLTWRNRRIIDRFHKQGYVTIKEDAKGKITVKITKNGLVRALSYQLDSMQIIKPKQWDGKWRVVIFDVPEKFHHLRDIFRMRLRQLGLYCLQESVYISPYPCFDEIEFLRELYGIAFTVRYLLVDKVEEDDFLRKHFHLS